MESNEVSPWKGPMNSEKAKAMWANPETRARIMAGMAKRKEKTLRRREMMKKLSVINRENGRRGAILKSKRRTLLRKIRFLPGAERIVKWVIR